MKIIAKRPDLLVKLYPPLFIVSVLLIVFFEKQVPYVFYINWLPLVATIYLWFTPFANIRLQNSTLQRTPLSPLRWFGYIILLECLCFIIYYGLSTFTVQLFPVIGKPHLISIPQILQLPLLKWGLCPWPLVSLIAISFGFMAFYKNENVTLMSLHTQIKPFRHKDYQIGLSFQSRLVNSYAYIIIIAFAILATSYLVAKQIHLTISSGLNVAALLITSLLLVMKNFKNYKKHLYSALNQNTPFAIVTTLLGATLVLIILAMSIFLQSQNIGQYPLTNGLRKFLLQLNWFSAWQIFIGIWWLCLSTSLGIFIARISYGYSIRKIISAILCLPLCLAIVTVFLLYGKSSRNFVLHSDQFNLILPIIAAIIFLFIVLQLKHIKSILRIQITPFKWERKRPYFREVLKILQSSLAVIGLYILLGSIGFNMLFFGLTSTVLLSSVFSTIAVWCMRKNHN